MSSFEFEEKNVDRAVKKACEELNVPKDEISYEVLSYGSSGIFGLAGAKKARIRVTVAENRPETVADFAAQTESVKRKLDFSNERLYEEEPSFENRDFDNQQLNYFPDNPLDLGRTVLQHIVDFITPDAKISAEETSERILLNVAGGNPAVLIGKKGQTLEAIQSLVEKIVNKHHTNHDKIRVQVDVEGYLETRKANLEKLAARLAEKSKRIRKPISLGQMSAYERRIVHMALKDDPDVRTKSRGEGYMRKLIIFPKKNNMHRHPLH
ncbi:MAG: Jag N-terminal domain-containing protein [Desulfobacterales bacterium]|nr:MAG: Jag N-terminal domain-containing protein [Desulfobacterales bacterium]